MRISTVLGLAGIALLVIAPLLIFFGCSPAPLGPVDHHPEVKAELPLANGELPPDDPPWIPGRND